jgi:uncharacterized protein
MVEDAHDMPYLSALADGTVLISLHVQPKASKTRIVGLYDGCVKIAVAAPPVEGKANKAVVAFVAKILGVPARDVSVKSGSQSKRKLLAVKALDVSEIHSMIEKVLTDI